MRSKYMNNIATKHCVIWYEHHEETPLDVLEDFVVVGDNWWIERHEYDGNEWWEYKEKPKQISEIKEVSHLAGGMWNKLAELNETEVDE